MRVFWILPFLLLLQSCDAQRKAPHLEYWAKFDENHVLETENAIREIANKRGLRLYEKSKDEMKILTQGRDAFYIVLYFHHDPILAIGNAGFGNMLSLMSFDYGNMPLRDLEKLTNEVVVTLSSRLKLTFEQEMPATQSEKGTAIEVP